MRIAGPDIVLFVVGLVLFSGATFAIIREGGPGALGEGGSALGVFNVAYEHAELEPLVHDVADYTSATASFDVNATHVAKAVVTVACTDTLQGPAAFQLQIHIEAPNGVTLDEAGACGQALEFEIPVAPEQPPATVAQGRTEEEARAGLPPLDNATAAQGTWTVEVVGRRPAPGPVPDPVPVAKPGGEISLTLHAWEPTLTPVQR